MRRKFDPALAAAGGAGLGAGLHYLLDPRSGARRRSRLKGRAIHAVKRAGDALGSAAADMAGRSNALAPLLRRAFRGGAPVEDRILAERVRAKLGRYVSHPRSISVIAADGAVTLSGPVLAREAPALLAHIRKVPGVLSVADALVPHGSGDGVPGLQGGHAPRRGERFELLQACWSPAFRLGAAGAGAACLLTGLARGGLRGAGEALAGLSLLARAWYNEPLRRVLGIGYGPAAVRLQKAVNIDAPVDLVFRVFASYDNFPLFMPHVMEVKDMGGGRSHWKVRAIPGVTVEWDAVITELIADRSLGWTSLEGAAVPNAGVIHFSPNRRGGTLVDIKLGYHPPAGELGHAFARLLGADPKRKLDRDLLIMKEFIERHAEAVSPAIASDSRAEGNRIADWD